MLAIAGNSYIFNSQVAATRPATDYTVRVIPRCDSVAIPLEDTRILWRR
jgi:glycogen phosphorylase